MADEGLLDSAYVLYCRGKYNLAYELFFDIALDGNAEAEYCVGMMLLNGTGVKADVSKAVDFLNDAAEGGCVPAMSELADVIAMDEERKAFDLFKKGSDAGDQYAMNRLSKFYDEGIGTKKNRRLGNELFERSNSTGDIGSLLAEAEKQLSARNYLKAKAPLMRAAVMGDPAAAMAVSRMYSKGLGVAASDETSGVWFDIAFGYGWNDMDISKGHIGIKKWLDENQ